MRHALLGMIVVAGAGCQHAAPSTVAAPATTPTAVEHAATAAQEPLPRTAAGVALGMEVSQVEGALGPLTCHDSTSGLKVCRGELDRINDINKLEIYVHRDRVISLAYEVDVPPNAWNFLDTVIAHYGSPSLSGKRELDQAGRTHEVFGWKDHDSLYSVRLIWGDTPAGARELMGTAITLWDRQAYQEWEAEALHHDQAPQAPERDGAVS